MEFLVPAEICTIVTVSAQQSLWCCNGLRHNLRTSFSSCNASTTSVCRAENWFYGDFVPAWSPLSLSKPTNFLPRRSAFLRHRTTLPTSCAPPVAARLVRIESGSNVWPCRASVLSRICLSPLLLSLLPAFPCIRRRPWQPPSRGGIKRACPPRRGEHAGKAALREHADEASHLDALVSSRTSSPSSTED